MRIAIYKDTLANNRGADVAVQNLAAGLSERGHAVVLFEKPELDVRLREASDVIVAAGTNELLDLAAAQVTIPVVLQFHTDPRYAFRHWIKKWRRNRAIKAAMRKCAAIQVLREEHVSFAKKIAPAVPVHVIGNYSSLPPHPSSLIPHPSLSHPSSLIPHPSSLIPHPSQLCYSIAS